MRTTLACSLVLVATFAIAGCKPLASSTYDTCYGAADCPVVDDCVQVMSTSNDRICTRSCVTGTDCPISPDGQYGVCLPVSSGGTVCYAHCSFDRDCPYGWICNLGTVRGAACTPQ